MAKEQAVQIAREVSMTASLVKELYHSPNGDRWVLNRDVSGKLIVSHRGDPSSPEDKLTGDLGNVIEATSIGGRRSDFFTAGKLAPGNFATISALLVHS
jgi:hypothetical protein